MLASNLEQIDEAFLRQLIADGVQESRVLDFKREPPGRQKDQDKSEFRKDVCAFANGDGGDIVYGIGEIDGKAASMVPIDRASENNDALERRMGQMLDELEPRVHGLQFRHVPVASGYITIVRVPASFDGPHSAMEKSARRFVVRVGSRTTDMTMDQLRMAFGRTAALQQSAREFAATRIRIAAEGKTQFRLEGVPFVTLTLIPLAGLQSGPFRPDIKRIAETGSPGLVDQALPAGWPGATRTINFDGMLVHPGATERSIAGYRMVHRNGAMEATQRVGFRNTGSGESVLEGVKLLTESVRALHALQRFVADAGATGPALIQVAVWGAQNADFYNYAPQTVDGTATFDTATCKGDRNLFVLPEIWLESVETQGLDATTVLRPALDVLWQAFGMSGCGFYRADGTCTLGAK